MRTFVKYYYFPATMLITVLFSIWIVESQLSKSLAIFTFVTSLFFLVLLSEQLFPYKEKWKGLGREELKDVVHSLLGTNLGTVLGSVFNTFIAATIIQYSSVLDGFNLWPIQIHMSFQVLILIVLSDFGRYWQHRLHHKYSSLWLFHELHHSDKKLNVFKASRSHIVERFVQQICMYLPLIIIGVNQDALFYFLMINSVLGLFTHANMDIRCGWFENVLMTPRNHKIHHSKDMVEGNSNFGSFTVIWDRIHGTFIHSSSLKDFDYIEVGTAYLDSHQSLYTQYFGPFIKTFKRLKIL
jgi:sterol desaturase/sphingolipid hydroxylase (fatty acid hydroxylase superfamily)